MDTKRMQPVMNPSHKTSWASALAVVAVVMGVAACSGTTSNSPSGSEVATSVASGSMNNTSGSTVGWNTPPKSRMRRMLDLLAPVSTAEAATWMCSGGKLNPLFTGPGGYVFTPRSCTVEWLDGKSGSSEWSGNFNLSFGLTCDLTHAVPDNQDANCAVTRTSAVGGNTRTITNSLGNAYAISHDTDGAGSGWDSSVTPAPTSAGVVLSCDGSGCSDGATLVINGSHLTGTVTPDGAAATKIWDHTVSTGASGLTVTGSGVRRVLTGAVTVQHNLAKFTSLSTFNDVGYGDDTCCFPTTGSISTTFVNGPDVGKTESLVFSAKCGEETLTNADGTIVELTMLHCL